MTSGYLQIADMVLMIRPIHFGPNPETADSNAFQHSLDDSVEVIKEKATAEFDEMVEKLSEAGIEVITLSDTSEPVTYDSVFPNNWLSFHNSRRAVLYPMASANRRLERRRELVEQLSPRDVLDLSHFEEQNKFLEGTGSMVLDRIQRIAYACRSSRTHEEPFNAFCNYFQYRPLIFDATDANGLPYYHTNVIMSMGQEFVVLCTEAVTDPRELIRSLEDTGKELISITREQVKHFAGNILQLENSSKEKFIIMSETALKSFTPNQMINMEKYGKILTVRIPTIEKYGGGSARCMMCEVI